jgi:hypothetical protein
MNSAAVNPPPVVRIWTCSEMRAAPVEPITYPRLIAAPRTIATPMVIVTRSNPRRRSSHNPSSAAMAMPR